MSLDFVRTHLPPGGIFVDCGANVGQYTLVGAEAVGPAGRVVAVEATANPMRRLRANAELQAFPIASPSPNARWVTATANCVSR